MIRRRDDATIVIPQTAHGWLAGQFALHWGNETFQIPEKGHREAWDVQVNFMLNDLKYTVDLEIQEKGGHVTSARLIDTMTPL